MEPYSEAVREAFFNTTHAGDLSQNYAQSLSASAAESGDGAEIVLAVGIVAEIIEEIRFRVWGCPHLIAAAETLCKDIEGSAVSRLSAFKPADISSGLAIPVEKTGRILLLEDALNSLWAQYSAAN